MKNKVIILLIVSLITSISGQALAEEPTQNNNWNLPCMVNDQNTKVNFEVDSTWHLFQGSTKNLYGKIWLKDPQDFNSVQAEIILPVAKFDTENGSRDKKMRKVMAEDQFKSVVFNLNKIKNLCNPESLVAASPCDITIIGKLTIRGVSQVISFPGKIQLANNKYQISGTATLDWSGFGVEDPSIIIAKVYKEMKVLIKVIL